MKTLKRDEKSNRESREIVKKTMEKRRGRTRGGVNEDLKRDKKSN